MLERYIGFSEEPPAEPKALSTKEGAFRNCGILDTCDCPKDERGAAMEGAGDLFVERYSNSYNNLKY
jgi:hypothetical protein